MPKRLHRKRSVARSLRKIAVAEIDVALDAIGDAVVGEAEAIHTVRQQMKRLRALVRLPRKRLAGWRGENIAFRDLARRLAGTRDAAVLGETFDAVAGEAPELRAALTAGHEGGSRRDLLAGEIVADLRAARDRVRRWQFRGRGFALIGAGLQRVYADMRRGAAAARAEPAAARFHEWRKQAKYHAGQLRLLRAIAPAEIEAHLATADQLADILGRHHDLDVLQAALDRLDGLPDDDHRRLRAAIDGRTAILEREAFDLADRLAAEPPARFRARIEAEWRAWRT